MDGGDIVVSDALSADLTDTVRARLPDFVREYVKCGNVVTAIQRARVQNPEYRMAVWADRLLSDAGVQRMIAEAEKEEREKPAREYTRESLAEDFQEIYERALATDEFSPAVSAKKAQAELLGMMEKNVRVTVTTNVSEMSMEELERELKRLTDEGVVTLTRNADGVYE